MLFFLGDLEPNDLWPSAGTETWGWGPRVIQLQELGSPKISHGQTGCLPQKTPAYNYSSICQRE